MGVCYKSISRILSWATIYLSLQLLTGINLPTPPDAVNEQLTLLSAKYNSALNNSGYTWHFSMQGLPSQYVTILGRELLPHVFTVARRSLMKANSIRLGSGSYFLWHFLYARLVLPRTIAIPAVHRCIALCCPDFPPRLKRRSDSLACSKSLCKERTAKVLIDSFISSME